MKKKTQKNKQRKKRKKTHPISRPKEILNSNSLAQKEEKENKKNKIQVVQKKETEKKKAEGKSIFRFINIAGQFLRESRAELKKVKWPTRKELLASTAMVIVFCLIVSFFLGLIDFLLIKIIKNIIG